MNRLFHRYTFNNGAAVKNRLVVAPMTHWASDEKGHITDEERLFLKGRAQDFGLFITAATLVSEEGKAFAGEPHAIESGDLSSLKEVADIIHAQGAKAILQIHHGGKFAIADIINGHDKIAPSGPAELPDMDDSHPLAANNMGDYRAATEEEINGLITSFGNATALAIQAGYDGVEIHGANGYLIQQFFSGHSNRRTDNWGGSIENRMRFPLAVVDAALAAREKHGRKDFIIGYRFSPEEPESDGITMADTFALIDALVKKPLQYLHVSLHDFFVNARRGANITRMRIVQLHERIAGKLPLIGVGNLLTSDQIKAAFDTRAVEFVALGKSVLLNPNMATLLKKSEFNKIETKLDPTLKEKYRFPKLLWEFNMKEAVFMPEIKSSTA